MSVSAAVAFMGTKSSGVNCKSVDMRNFLMKLWSKCQLSRCGCCGQDARLSSKVSTRDRVAEQRAGQIKDSVAFEWLEGSLAVVEDLTSSPLVDSTANIHDALDVSCCTSAHRSDLLHACMHCDYCHLSIRSEPCSGVPQCSCE